MKHRLWKMKTKYVDRVTWKETKQKKKTIRYILLNPLPDDKILTLNIFILHRLRNKFLQLILISLDSASWELHQYSRRMCGPMKKSQS